MLCVHSFLHPVNSTMQAAEFLGCKASRDQVLKYLKDVLIGIVEYSQKNLAAQASSDVAQTVLVHQPYSRAWHSTQVKDAHCLKSVAQCLKSPLCILLTCRACDMNAATGAIVSVRM